MARNVDLTEAIRSMVEQEVNAALAPYRSSLDRIGAFLGGGAAPARRGPGRPPGRPAGSTANRTRRPRGVRAQDRGDASKFEKGQRVQINVGRGQKFGKVMGI